MQALKEDSLLVVSSKKSFLDKCRLLVGIKLFVSAGHSDTDLIKASESLKRLASELLLSPNLFFLFITSYVFFFNLLSYFIILDDHVA